MLRIVRDHFAPLCRAVQSNAMFIGNQIVMPSMYDEHWAGIGFDACKIIEWVFYEKAGE
jgi:hypothetical protein